MKCRTCEDKGIEANWRLQYGVSIHRTAAELRASSSTCILCAAIWHGLWQFPEGRAALADPSHMDIRFSYHKGESFKIRDGHPIPGAGRAHYDPAFTIIAGLLPGEGFFPWKREGTHISEELETIPKMPVVEESPLSVKTRDAVMKQIQECKTGHEHQLKHHYDFDDGKRKQYVPDRLVDLGSDSSNLDAVLLDDTSKVKQPFVALSHCWGGTIPYRTLKANKRDLCQRIEFSRLSQNFKDAFTVARWLSYRYIWIDSFCIVQDDREDWLQQSSKMADVYSGADLTISATRTASHTEGFLTDRYTDNKLGLTNRLPAGISLYARDCERLELSHQGINRQPSEHTPLFMRAWGFQERLLSKRVLHFLNTECECSEYDTYPDSKYDKEVYHSSSWEELVEQYTSRKMTCQDDVLPAISAVARDYAYKAKYYAGLMEADLYPSLLWRVKAPRDLYGGLITPAPIPKRPSIYVAPTFSWASVIGAVEWATNPRPSLQQICRIISYGTTLVNKKDRFGCISDGYITINGPSISVELQSMPKVNPSGKSVTADMGWYYQHYGLVLMSSAKSPVNKKFFENATDTTVTVI
ncbi:heterokaryon incompatibility protein-domain-containing protein [Xylariaceae sp. FL0255]|nr:heterokaryon incompatibility protein-domain-containing protein [Xylariaceae sp. FL0255]